MIKSITSRALKRYWERGDESKINGNHLAKVKRIMRALDAAAKPTDMMLPGYRFHKMSGGLKGFYSVDVSGNWRIIFKFEDSDAIDVDYLDTHGN